MSNYWIERDYRGDGSSMMICRRINLGIVQPRSFAGNPPTSYCSLSLTVLFCVDSEVSRCEEELEINSGAETDLILLRAVGFTASHLIGY